MAGWFCLYIFLALMAASASANVVLIGRNITLSFDDIEANFAPSVEGNGVCGTLHLADPLDACTPLTNKIDPIEGINSPFALIVRGGCNFEEKVRRAQMAGFKAVIIYDNEDNGGLVAMAGNSAGIKIYAVFVSKASGELLRRYVDVPNMKLWIMPSFENSAWSIIATSFISLLAMSAVLATCFFVRRHRIRRERPQASNVREFHGMSSHLVKAMPSLIFTSVLEDNCTSQTCAICLEDYIVGDKLRILPCRHKFHAACVDSWLTSWRTFCPVCKRDARTVRDDPPASESTPLLSAIRTSASSSALSSFRSSFATSSAIQIAPASSRLPSVSRPHSLSSSRNVPESFRSYCNSTAVSQSRSSAIQIPPSSSKSPSVSRPHSLSSTPYVPESPRSYGNSPAISLSRSSMDLRNEPSQRVHATNLVPPHSMRYPSPSPHSSRYISPYVPSSSNASPSYAGSSNRQTYLRYCSESAASFSPFASAQSLPGC